MAGRRDEPKIRHGLSEPFWEDPLGGLLLPGESYAKAGVNLSKLKKMQRSLAETFGATFRNRDGKGGAPLKPIGHYSGVIDLGGEDCLTLHTDGVGSKVLVAQEMDKFDTVGIDCVAVTVNDLVCMGSEPVALLDYIALERQDDTLIEQLAKGIVEGARLSSTAIVGGETAVLGDMVKGAKGKGFDLVSMGVGLVKKNAIVDGSDIAEGDSIIGVASSGLHSNGYTLARRIVKGRSLRERVDSLSSTIGDALLTPTAIYVKPTLEATRRCELHGIGHITGGSFSKLSRLVGERRLMFDIVLPPPPPIFNFLKEEGDVSEREMYRTFNMGVGLCLCLPEAESVRASRVFRSHGFATFPLGSVSRGRGVKVNGLPISA
ncbi:MAG: phosphoribosylformylglycinamidine cyclo-ligase [Thaumarchaeota archaeon]|nr:phosphoribosylformylglycinamidine cyclo-ligase [Nitrososphaerota archaeon]